MSLSRKQLLEILELSEDLSSNKGRAQSDALLVLRENASDLVHEVLRMRGVVNDASNELKTLARTLENDTFYSQANYVRDLVGYLDQSLGGNY